MSETAAIALPVEKIRAYCETQPIERLLVLGTDFDPWLRPDTQIGIAVDYKPGAVVTLLDMAGQEIDLGNIIGRPVSLNTSEGLRRGYPTDYVDGAKLIYAN
ncbi:MAG: hypothetical protein F4X02_09715 [Chloroflexi bacterium]|nr:hypothetical protein [Chloroflexota bacterium]